jgi:RHS repeat-associated protein
VLAPASMSPKLPPKTRRVLGEKSHLRGQTRVHGKPQYPGPDKVVSGLRYYNPGTGRWVNRDPIGEKGGANRYAMLANDCLNAIDAIGLEKQTLCNLRNKWGSGYGLLGIGSSKGNCWRYAADDPMGPDEDHYVDPVKDTGQILTCSEIRSAIINRGGVGPKGSGKCSCPDGMRRIKLVISLTFLDKLFGSNDYHFYRQETDGSWTHKPGNAKVEETYSPDDDAKERGYNQNCGDLCIPNNLV